MAIAQPKWFANPKLWVANEMPIFEAIQECLISKSASVKLATKFDSVGQPDEHYIYEFTDLIVTKIFKNGSINLRNLDTRKGISFKKDCRFKIIKGVKILFI